MACLAGTAWTGCSTRQPTPVDDRGDFSYAVVESSVDLVEEMAKDAPVLSRLRICTGRTISSLTVLVGADAAHHRVSIWRDRVDAAVTCPPALDRLVERVRDAGAHVRLGALDEVDVVAMASAITGGAPGGGSAGTAAGDGRQSVVHH